MLKGKYNEMGEKAMYSNNTNVEMSNDKRWLRMRVANLQAQNLKFTLLNGPTL